MSTASSLFSPTSSVHTLKGRYHFGVRGFHGKPDPKPVTKELYFNRDGSAIKKLQAGMDLLANLVGVTLGPKGRNVVLQNKYGPPKIVNDGVTVCKEFELEDPLENIGAKLVRQAAAKTNDIAGDGSTTSIILAQGLITEGLKVITAGASPTQIARGIEKTAKFLVDELNLMTKEVEEQQLADVAAVSAGNDHVVGNLISDAFKKVGWNGVVTVEKGKCIDNTMEFLEGMHFDRGYLSPYFVTDREKMSCEFNNCKLLLVDKKITNAKEVQKVLESSAREKYPIVIVAEGIEQEALAPIIKNKLRGVLKVAAVKAPSFGQRKSHCLDDIAILTGGSVIRDEMGLNLAEIGKEVLGSADKMVITKDSTLIITDGSTQNAVNRRIAQIQALIENSEEKFDKKILKERVARLSRGIATIKVGAFTEPELKDKTLRVEDALNAVKAAIEEGIVVGGGCSLLRLSLKVDRIKECLENEQEKIGADIFRRALSYPIKLIAKNAGVNGNVIVEKVLAKEDTGYGYNAAKDQFEDLISAGIIDPSKVVRCCLIHAASVAKVFLTCDVVVAEIKDMQPIPLSKLMSRRPRPMEMPFPMKKPMKVSGIGF